MITVVGNPFGWWILYRHEMPDRREQARTLLEVSEGIRRRYSDENCRYVRDLLKERQPILAAALDQVVRDA
jgi:hypothetical protein